MSGLTDQTLAELAAITWLIDPHGRTMIEGKADVKSALGHSPDLAEALMIAIGEAAPEPFAYTRIPFVSRASIFAGQPGYDPRTDRQSSRAVGWRVAAAEDAAADRWRGRWPRFRGGGY